MEPNHDAENSAAYVEWKGWGTPDGFGALLAGESDYFAHELRDLRRVGTQVTDVLEIGYGNGSFLSYCRSRGWNVVGTELSPELVTAGIDAGFDVHSADQLESIADRSFDLVVAFDVLEHIPQDAMADFLSTLSSKVRVGGALFLRFPNADSWLGNAMQNGDPTHLTAIGYLKMVYFAQRSALEIVRFRGARRKGFSTSAIHGIYRIVAVPLITLVALIARGLYFPDLPVVLSTSNVVCILKPQT